MNQIVVTQQESLNESQLNTFRYFLYIANTDEDLNLIINTFKK
jgi:hypothetical protein